MGTFFQNIDGLRQVDINNAKSANDAEMQANIQLLTGMLTAYSSMVTNKGGYRQTDMNNVVAFLNKQGQKEGMTVQQLAQLWAEYYQAKAKAIQITSGHSTPSVHLSLSTDTSL